jgi:predicted ester cyclase
MRTWKLFVFTALFVFAGIFSVVYITGCGLAGKKYGKAAVSQAFEDAYNKGETGALDKYLAADVVRHFPPSPDSKGLDAFKQAVLKSRSDYPVQKLTIHSTIREGNTSASRWTHQFTDGTTGKQIIITGCSMLRWENGKIVEWWHAGDILGRYQQLGFKMLPPITPSTFAIVSVAQLKPGKMEDLVKWEKEMSVPLMKSAKEFHGFLFLGDVKTGKVFSVSTWDSEEAWTDGIKDEKVKAYFKDFSDKTKDFFSVKPIMKGYRLIVQE